MDSALSLKYTRTVQQLQKKKDELDQVFVEARKLEADNEALLKENRELKSQNAQLESAAKAARADVAALEAQVMKQQAKLQQYIDKELNSSAPPKKDLTPQTPSATPSGPNKSAVTQLSADLAEAKRQLAALEDARRTALEAAEKYRKGSEMLYNEVVSLRNEVAACGKESAKLRDEIKTVKKSEATLKDVVKKLHERNVDVAKETDEMDRIEMKALEGLKAELMVLASENHRLTATIEEERRLHREARSEFEKFENLVRKQRSLSDGHVRVSAEELRNLSAQTDSLLEDVKRLTVERDTMKKQLADAQQRLSQPLPITSPTKSAKTPSKGHVEADAIAATLQQAKQLRETLLKATTERGTNTTEAYPSAAVASPTSLTTQQHQLLHKSLLELTQQNETLRGEVSSLQYLLNEKEATNALRLEKQTLLEEELSRTKAELSQSKRQKEVTPLEMLLQSPRPNNEEKVFIDKLKELVGSTLVTASRTFKQFQEQPNGGRMRSVSISSTSSAGDGDESQRPNDVVPIVPCRKFTDAVMNSIFEQIGGIRHILRRLSKFAEGLQAESRRGAPDRETHEAKVQQQSSSRFNLEAWLHEREAKVAQDILTTPPPSTLQRQSRASDYHSGESLLDSIEELRRTPTVQRGPISTKRYV